MSERQPCLDDNLSHRVSREAKARFLTVHAEMAADGLKVTREALLDAVLRALDLRRAKEAITEVGVLLSPEKLASALTAEARRYPGERP